MPRKLTKIGVLVAKPVLRGKMFHKPFANALLRSRSTGLICAYRAPLQVTTNCMNPLNV